LREKTGLDEKKKGSIIRVRKSKKRGKEEKEKTAN